MRGENQLGAEEGMTNNNAILGKIWAICDHFQRPVSGHVLKMACGVDRKQLRQWVRKGRLSEFTIISETGQVEKAYCRPGREPKEGVRDAGRGCEDTEG